MGFSLILLFISASATHSSKGTAIGISGTWELAENNAAFDIALDALENYNDVAIKMSGNGEPMATEEPAEASPSSTKITFENVRIQSLSEDAGAKDKYPGDNNKIRVEYDPEVSASRSNQESLP